MASKQGEWVLCVDNAGYERSLKLRAFYQSIVDRDAKNNGQVRVIDESGEAHQFPAHCFAGTKPVFVGMPKIAGAAAAGLAAGWAVTARLLSSGTHQSLGAGFAFLVLGFLTVCVLVVALVVTLFGSRTIGPLIGAAAIGLLAGFLVSLGSA